MRAHDCRLRSLQVFEDEDGYFWVKDQCHMPFGKEHNFRVEYCPVCGEKSKRSHMANMRLFKRTDIPEAIPDPLHTYQSMMVQSIEDMNRNIESIKAFMISQNAMNDSFIFSQMEMGKRICELENKKS